MRVREIMTTDIQRATPDNLVSDIAALMRDEDISAVPIVDDGELRGIVTDRDIVIRAVADGRNPSTTKAEDVLSAEIESVGPDTDIKEAADLQSDNLEKQWPSLVEEPARHAGLPVPKLVLLDSPYRVMVAPIGDYIL